MLHERWAGTAVIALALGMGGAAVGQDWTEATDRRISDLKNSRLIVYSNPQEADKRIEFVGPTIARLMKKHMLNPVRKTVFLIHRRTERDFSPKHIERLLEQVFPESFVGLVMESCALLWSKTS